MIVGKIKLLLKKVRIRILSKKLRPHVRVYFARLRHKKKMKIITGLVKIDTMGSMKMAVDIKVEKIQRCYRSYKKLKNYFIKLNTDRWRILE